MNSDRKIQYRAAMIPYIIQDDGIVSMMFMQPSDTRYGGHEFQLCKGVVEEGEDNRTAAIREGREELGLRQSNIISVTELGNFLGRTSVYICKVKDTTSFDAPHYETSATSWMSCDNFLEVGRELHKSIVKLAEQVILREEEELY